MMTIGEYSITDLDLADFEEKTERAIVTSYMSKAAEKDKEIKKLLKSCKNWKEQFCKLYDQILEKNKQLAEKDRMLVVMAKRLPIPKNVKMVKLH